MNINIETPYPIVDYNKLTDNINEMAELAQNNECKIRPMIKTHKSPDIAKMQIKAGAVGLTVATLEEAETMIDKGIKDVFIAYEIIGRIKMKRLSKLMQKANISVAVDNIDGAKRLNNFLKEKNMKLDYLLEINTGLDRCGVNYGKPALKFVKKIKKECPALNLKGIFTHAGQVYGVQTLDEIKKIGELEGNLMGETARLFRENGLELKIISVGSTPTVKYSSLNPEVNEIRPGNYVFYDNIQIGLGIILQERVAFKIRSMVISKTSSDKVIIDAGSKTLALDQGAHGVELVNGFGLVSFNGRIREDLIIDHLSEEHGFVISKKDYIDLEIGDMIEIIPNHSCVVANLFDKLVLKKEDNYSLIDVAARRKVRIENDE